MRRHWPRFFADDASFPSASHGLGLVVAAFEKIAIAYIYETIQIAECATGAAIEAAAIATGKASRSGSRLLTYFVHEGKIAFKESPTDEPKPLPVDHAN
jgi:hypothetical protein